MSRRRSPGFTLIEMMVALALVSLMSLAMFQAYRFSQRALLQTVRVDSATHDVAVAQRFLRRVIEQAYPFESAADTGKLRGLEGDLNRFAVTAPALAAEGSSGFQRFEISLDQSGELAASWSLDRNGKRGNDTDTEPQREVLLSGVQSLSISYLELIELGSGQVEPHWSDSWQGKSAMPALVRVQVRFAAGERGAWPELVVAPRITTDANCVFDVVSQTCRVTG